MVENVENKSDVANVVSAAPETVNATEASKANESAAAADAKPQAAATGDNAGVSQAAPAGATPCGDNKAKVPEAEAAAGDKSIVRVDSE